MISRQNVIKFCWKDKKFLSCSAMKMVQLKRSKTWMHHRFFENSSSSRWLTSGKRGSRGRSQGRNLLFKDFKTVKLLGGDSWKNPLSSSRLLTLGKGVQEAGHREEICCSKISKPSNYSGETVEKILYLRPGYSHWAKGFKRPVTGEKLFVPKFWWTWNYLGWG